MTRLQQLLEASTCPLNTKVYGGLPADGGYESNTEYEIGARRFAEASHCILGSLHRALNRPQDRSSYRIETGHIEEETEIIEEIVNEYSKALYIGRIWEDSAFKDQSVESIKSISPRLAKKASTLMRELQDDAIPPIALDLARASYKAVIVLAEEMEKSVKNYPSSISNAFQAPQLRSAVKDLRSKVNQYHREYK